MLNHLFSLSIRPNGRAAADEYYHNGVTWIEGREGSKYTIFLKNLVNSRLQFIVSVDGLDVLDGKPAGINSRGYVVDPNATLEIPGWRLNNQEAAEFYFSKKSNSYVSEIGGSVANTGVIGVMAFVEQQLIPNMSIWPPGYPPITWTYPNSLLYSSVRGATAMQNSTGPVAQNLCGVGTGFGDAINHPTQATNFISMNPSSWDAMSVIYYDTAENLKRQGIQLKTRTTVSTPNPFPGNTDGCRPPPSWVR